MATANIGTELELKKYSLEEVIFLRESKKDEKAKTKK
jgi:hypothetical protein